MASSLPHPSCSAPSPILLKPTELDANRNPLQRSVLTSLPASPDPITATWAPVILLTAL
ncbi:hypothetical protein I79_001036 [Cricetulus griseus]|uniref:Uncharacterized protein n=1 Tax=Cricetulus griseus TaxID=10029 RepID=G3GTP9_CRIGR|nr:hypothetical protein I79_001036 [Cricetulus griseus]